MEWVVNATPLPLYPRERPGTNCIGGWVGPQGRSGRVRKISLPPGFDPRNLLSYIVQNSFSTSEHPDWEIPHATELQKVWAISVYFKHGAGRNANSKQFLSAHIYIFLCFLTTARHNTDCPMTPCTKREGYHSPAALPPGNNTPNHWIAG